MAAIGTWLRRLRLLAQRDRVERVMDDELRHHVECEIADRVRGGMPPEEARRTALRDFGGLESIKEQARDARGGRGLEDLWLDVRYGTRVLRRTPGDTIAAIVTFALGVGAVTAIFSLVYGILLRPLPYADPGRLVVVWERNIPRDRDRNVVSLENYEAWRDGARGASSVAAVVPTSITLPGDRAPERIVGAEVTPGYFGTLGVAPALGRDFDASDARDGLSVILSDALWRRRFSADPSIVGRAITMSGKSYAVVGVMPAGFEPPQLGWLGQQDLWFPFVPTPQSRAWGRFLIVIARLAPDVTIEQFRSEMVSIAAERARTSPANDGWSASVAPLIEEITGEVRASLLVLLGAVALLLLMSIANVTTLSLAGMQRRAPELAVRRAIGATDRRLFRQLFTQSALLGTLGAIAGALVAVPGVRILVALLPPDIPRPGSVSVDAPVLFVTGGIALAATLFFGSLAAFRGQSGPAVTSLAAEASASRTTRRRSDLLVATEIALAGALGIIAMLTVRSYARLTAVDLGFSPDGVLISRLALPGTYATPERTRMFYERLAERVRALPGVTAAGIISARPLSGIGPATTARDALRPPDPNGQDPVADVRLVDDGAFRALGIVLERGSGFDARDATGPARVLISATLARALWPDGDAIGRALALEIYGGTTATVAGVFRDVHLFDARTPPRPLAYLPAARYPDNVRDLVVRVDGDPEAIVPSLRAAVASMDPSLPLYSVSPLTTLVNRSTARDRLTMVLLGGFGAVALLLAAVGVFGVFASDVASRRKELGIRLALGASEPGLVLLLLRNTLRRVTLGLLAGGLAALSAGQAMGSVLFGISAADPFSFTLVGMLVASLAAGATLIPGWQALRRAPLAALRAEESWRVRG
jgi:putative ABC transport system permease protein